MSTRIDINFKIVKQQMTLLTKEPLRQMDANYFYAVFDLCETWSTVNGIKASFARDDEGLYFVVDLVPGENGCLECQIPWEVLQKKGQFYVGVFGGNRILTNKVRVDVADSCYCDGEYPEAPTQDWFAQVEYQLEHITIDESQIESAVNDYLTEHPVTVTETDPTVPEWAKAATKPTYTAAEVGAAPEVHSHDDLYYTKTQIDSAGYLTSIPAEYITETELNNAIPTKVSQLENDADYQTAEQVTEGVGQMLNIILPDFGDNVVAATLEQVDARGYATTNDVATAVSDKITMDDLNNATADFITEVPTDTFGYPSGVMAKCLTINDVGAVHAFSDASDIEGMKKALENGEIIRNISGQQVIFDFSDNSDSVVYKISDDGTRTNTGRTMYLESSHYAVKVAYANYAYSISTTYNGIKKFFQNIYYDNSNSGLAANTLPDAIDELKDMIPTEGGSVAIATVDAVGTVKPDGTSITIDEDGTISGAGENVLKAYNGYSVNLTRQTANKINGGLCVAAGGYNTLNGYYGFTSGSSNTLSTDNGTAFGRNNSIYSMVGFTAGDYCEVNGYRGAAFGYGACANNQNTFAIGDHTEANSATQFVCGKYNIIDNNETYAVIVGNGEGDRSNAYTLDWSGNAVFAGTVSNSGADYAEYFEWFDGNTDNEDRVGFIVTLEGDKIKKANDGNDMLGIISGTMTVLGDDAEWYWHGRYLKDEFGRIQYHYVDEDVIECQRFENEDGTIEWRDVVVGKKQVLCPIVNPKYDATETYVSRKDRKEWDAVGMLGKLYVRDDGTCKVNGYAKCGNCGIATAADCITNMRVLQRVNDNIIRVLLK